MSRLWDAMLRLLGEMPPGFDLIRDLHVDGGGSRPLRMHIAVPRRRRLRPAIAFIFGGGWDANGPDQGLAAIAGLALKGYVAAAIDYRLSHEAKFPAQLQDCKCCIRYLRSRAEEWGIDADRIGVLGLSSGGHLGALLGTTAGRTELEGYGCCPDERTDVQAVAVWSAPVDFLRLAEDHGNIASPNSRTARLVGGPLIENPALVAAANPLTYVTASTPPFLVVHGAKDRLVPPGQGQVLHQVLLATGVRSRLLMIPGKGHGFLGLKAVRETLAFFDRELRHR